MRIAIFFAMLAALLAGGVHADPALLTGIDHVPIVVGDLEKAENDFRAMGFVIKPGRPHDDGIRNGHVKFPDGTELELITAPAAVDALTAEYHAKQKAGDGPIYFGLLAPDQAAVAARLRARSFTVGRDGNILTLAGAPLHHLFFGTGEKAPTDRPEHFAHANTALRVSGFWVRGNDEERAVFRALGVTLRRIHVCGPLGAEAEVAALPGGDVILVDAAPRDGGVMGARIEVRNIGIADALFKKNGLEAQHYDGCGRPSLWLLAHGIWLQFVQASA